MQTQIIRTPARPAARCESCGYLLKPEEGKVCGACEDAITRELEAAMVMVSAAREAQARESQARETAEQKAGKAEARKSRLHILFKGKCRDFRGYIARVKSEVAEAGDRRVIEILDLRSKGGGGGMATWG